MAEIASIALSVEDTARLLHLQVQTVRRRLKAGELEGARPVGGGPARVRLVPAETLLRVEDASALLGVSPATIRSNIARGRLQGQRGEHGRWRVQLGSVLEDSRCTPEARALFTGEGSFAAPANRSIEGTARRSSTLHRQLSTRLSAAEAELLERARDRFGTIHAAVVAGLLAVDRDDVDVALDPGEAEVERELFREELERLRVEHDALRERAEGRMVDELYCQVCEGWVPVEECAAVDVDGRFEVFHEKHGHRSGGRFRMDTGLARRQKLPHERAA